MYTVDVGGMHKVCHVHMYTDHVYSGCRGPCIKCVKLSGGGIQVSVTERYMGMGVSWRSLRSLLK